SFALVELDHEPETQLKNEKESFVVVALATLEDEETVQKTWNLTANFFDQQPTSLATNNPQAQQKPPFPFAI
ncbi:unnamed protein product, partial [Prunus brigantina]